LTTEPQTNAIPTIGDTNAAPAETGGAPASNLSAHDQAMIAKARSAGTPPEAAEVDPGAATVGPNDTDPPTTAERPDNVPEAYWNAEKGEVDLEALLIAVAAPAPEVAPEVSPEGEQEVPKSFDWDTLDLNALGTEVATTGNFSAETIEALKSTGIPESIITNYAEGLHALGQQQVNGLFSIVEGKDNFSAMINWAGQGNVTQEQADAFDAAMDRPGDPLTKMMVENMYARFKAAEGSEPALVGGSTPAQDGSDRFQNAGEVTAAMRDPRYGKPTAEGRAYTAAVMDRMAKSTVKWS